MSHFVVVVIGDDVEGQLAPYDENIEVEPYKERVDDDDRKRFIEFYNEKGADTAKAKGFHPIIEANFRGAWAALSDDWNDSKAGWDEEGPFTWSQYNPKSRWDWWVVGGRWTGYWKLKPGANSGRLGESGAFDNSPRFDADAAPKGDIDFNAMEQVAAAAAVEAWAKWEVVMRSTSPATPWEEFITRVDAKELGIEVARTLYHEQPQVKALKTAFPDNWDISPADFGTDRQEYIDRRVAKSWVPFALVHQGEWHEKGRMGWFGMSTDRPEDQAPWAVEVRSMILNLPDKMLLTAVDCHI